MTSTILIKQAGGNTYIKHIDGDDQADFPHGCIEIKSADAEVAFELGAMASGKFGESEWVQSPAGNVNHGFRIPVYPRHYSATARKNEQKLNLLRDTLPKIKCKKTQVVIAHILANGQLQPDHTGELYGFPTTGREHLSE